jgi:lysophospholipase L1-like esterase
MAINVGPGTKIVFVGDSITADGWFDATQSDHGGANLLVQQLSQPTVTPRYGTLAPGASAGIVAHGSTVGSVAPVTGGGQVYAINSGVAGNQIADIEAAIPARITNYNPAVVVMLIGINDCRGVPIGPTPLATFRASYDNILATVKSTLPSVQILCVGMFVLFELWASSPPPAHFSGNALDSGAGSIDNYNAQISASAVAHGFPYVDIRAPGGLAEAVQNTPEPGVNQGILTVDGIHPGAAGQLVLSTAVRAAFTFSP